MPISRSASGTTARTRIGTPSRCAGPPRRGGVLVTGRDVEHHAGHDLAVELGGDRHGVLRDAVEEVHGAVDRVDDPADAGGAGLVVALLAQEPVVGAGVEERPPDQPLGAPVGLGDHVDVAGLGGGDRRRRGRAPDSISRPASRAVRTASSSSSSASCAGSVTTSSPHRAGRSARGLGQQPTGQRSHSGPSAPTPARTTSSPRSAAARSSSRSRTIATNRGSAPAVAARRDGQAEPLGGGQRLGVEVVDDLHVVGDEADRDQHDGRDAVLARAPRGGR